MGSTGETWEGLDREVTISYPLKAQTTRRHWRKVLHLWVQPLGLQEGTFLLLYQHEVCLTPPHSLDLGQRSQWSQRWGQCH